MPSVLVMASHAGLQRQSPGWIRRDDLLFLSGYLITSLLRIEVMREREMVISGHSICAAHLRIMPPLYITFVILTALAPLSIFG